MGMFIPNSFLHHIKFTLGGPALADAIDAKVEKLRIRSVERTERIKKLREAHNLSDGDLIQLLQQALNMRNAAAYVLAGADGQARTIEAGVVAALVAEDKERGEEAAAKERLERVRRNADVSNEARHSLDYDDLVLLDL